MSSTKIEFAVQMKCQSCVNAIRKALENQPGINHVDIDLAKNTVVVDTVLSTLQVQRKIEETGKKVRVKGHAGNLAGVSVLEKGRKDIQGVVRFIQKSDCCIVDATVDGLQKGHSYRLEIHENGDISQGCASVGGIYHPSGVVLNGGKKYGELGTVTANQTGRGTLRKELKHLKLTEVIGRSVVLKSNNEKLVCGIIARSAGLFQNPKTICACDGTTIWDEQKLPKKAEPKKCSNDIPIYIVDV